MASTAMLTEAVPVITTTSQGTCRALIQRSSASTEPSYVLRAMGLDTDWAASSIRFGLGRGNDRDQVERVADHVVATVNRLRENSPLWQRRGQAIDW